MKIKSIHSNISLDKSEKATISIRIDNGGDFLEEMTIDIEAPNGDRDGGGFMVVTTPDNHKKAYHITVKGIKE